MLEAAIGFFGVLVGAFISWKTTQIGERKKNAVSLYSDFASSDMEKVRHKAINYLSANLKSQNPLTFQEMHNSLDSEELINVSRILHFWERTWYFIENDYVDEQLTIIFLQHYFKAHYINVLKDFASICRKKDNDNYQRWIKSVNGLARQWNID